MINFHSQPSLGEPLATRYQKHQVFLFESVPEEEIPRHLIGRHLGRLILAAEKKKKRPKKKGDQNETNKKMGILRKNTENMGSTFHFNKTRYIFRLIYETNLFREKKSLKRQDTMAVSQLAKRSPKKPARGFSAASPVWSELVFGVDKASNRFKWTNNKQQQNCLEKKCVCFNKFIL